jgi:mRNA-degrading endonuclease toxin of MazEF toxin-antitoxin module
MVVIVSRDTGRDGLVVAYITDPEIEADPPVAADIVPVAGMNCSPPVRGFIRCDQLFYLEKDDGYWGTQVTHISGDDMRKIEDGLRAALMLDR